MFPKFAVTACKVEESGLPLLPPLRQLCAPKGAETNGRGKGSTHIDARKHTCPAVGKLCLQKLRRSGLFVGPRDLTLGLQPHRGPLFLRKRVSLLSMKPRQFQVDRGERRLCRTQRFFHFDFRSAAMKFGAAACHWVAVHGEAKPNTPGVVAGFNSFESLCSLSDFRLNAQMEQH
jgi:hypothetical protein